MTKVIEKMVDVYAITKFAPDGSVLTTKRLGLRWVSIDEHAPEGFIFSSVSMDYKGMTVRTRKIED